MAVHIWRNRRQEKPAEAAAPTQSKRLWPRRTAPAESAPATVTQPKTKTVVVERRREPRSWRRRGRHNPISGLILGAAWAAVLILGLGMLLTLTNANPGNGLVDATFDAGRWLATPFHDVFTNPDPDHALYMNWGLAAGAYYLLGRALSYLTRF